MDEDPSRTLTILLLKPGTKTPVEKGTTHHTLKIPGTTKATLHTRQRDPLPPRWATFFDDTTINPPLTITTSGADAILLISAHGREFALTFGYGRHLLRPGTIEDTFGLRVALNTITGNIRTIDRQALDTHGRHTREQASKATRIDEFSIDTDTDLLRAVQGIPDQNEYGHRLSGREALTITRPITINTLPGLLKTLLAAYKRHDYKKKFAFIDYITQTNDQDTITALDNNLIIDLRANRLKNMWLALPEIISWEHTDGFAYRTSRKAPVHADLHLRDYLTDARPPGTLTINHLHNDRVHEQDDEGHRHPRWTIYKCLYAERTHQDQTYFLTNGAWYRLDQDYKKRVVKGISAIPTSTVLLPPYDHKDEGEYNTSTAAASRGALTLLDRELIGLAGYKGRIEVCDLLHSRKTMIHVKHFRSSEVLSHLFAQGIVAGTLFASDADFRAALNKQLPARLRLRRPAAPITPSDYEITFAIIGRLSSADDLPFFSKVMLYKAHKLLGGLGYNVTMAYIPNQKAASQPAA